MAKAVNVLEEAWKKNYLKGATLPEWTKSQTKAITKALELPETTRTPRGYESDCECLLCNDFVVAVPSEQKSLMAHMLEEHSLVIGDVSCIADLPGYIKYWKNKLKSKSLEDFCTLVRANVTETRKKKSPSVEKDFYLLCDNLKEDRDLRIHLQLKRLEEILEIQEKERADPNFNRSCLFCRKVFHCKPADLLNHMSQDHNFNIGQPHNLVFIEDLLNILEDKLENKICIFCENVFKTREVLKEHMRKKGHKKINPKNSAYDRFYVVNYREFGKKWEPDIDFDEDDEMPNGFNSGDDDSENEEKEWNDWRGDEIGAICLFCKANYADLEELFMHMTTNHDFDFKDVRNSLKLNFYQQVKLINYIRRQMHLNKCIFCLEDFDSHEALVKHMETESHFKVPENNEEWNQPQYFFSTYENDNLLSCLDDEIFESNESVPVESEDLPESVATSILKEREFRESVCPSIKQKKSPQL